MRTTMATENNNKTLNVPNLRFPEFSGEWTKTLLNNYLEENKERNKRGIFTKNHVLSVSGDFGIVNQIELLGRSFAGKSVLDYHVVRTGNIVYTKSPLKEYPYGIVKVNGGVDGIVSTLYAVYKVKETANGKFVEYYFGLPNRTNRYFKPIVSIGAKHDMKIGNDEVLANYVVFPCVDEQKRISDFICLLDERIATQIKIIEDLKKLKSAISNEIFEQTSNRICELKEIASVIMGQSPSSHAYNNNAEGLPLIQGNLDRENGQLSPRIYTSEITQTCECGDVILTVRAPVGEIAIAQQEACIGRGVCSIRPHVKNDTNLIYQFLQYFRPKWGSLEQGSTFTAVSGTDIRGIAVSIPSADKIELLNVYDNKIKVESRILANLIQQKQYLLAQMFI